MGFIKSNNSKKDFIVINPPYKGWEHTNIFNKAFDVISKERIELINSTLVPN
jgi:hypothetical protein